jgi:hypothetical protein
MQIAGWFPWSASFNPSARTTTRGMVHYGAISGDQERTRLLPASAGVLEGEDATEESGESANNESENRENVRVADRSDGNPWV